MPPNWGPGLQPRHRPWLGIEPVTLWFTGRHSIHWATSGMYTVKNLIYLFNIFINIYMLVPIIYMYNVYTYIYNLHVSHKYIYKYTHTKFYFHLSWILWNFHLNSLFVPSNKNKTISTRCRTSSVWDHWFRLIQMKSQTKCRQGPQELWFCHVQCALFCPNCWVKNKDAHYVWLVLILHLYKCF